MLLYDVTHPLCVSTYPLHTLYVSLYTLYVSLHTLYVSLFTLYVSLHTLYIPSMCLYTPSVCLYIPSTYPLCVSIWSTGKGADVYRMCLQTRPPAAWISLLRTRVLNHFGPSLGAYVCMPACVYVCARGGVNVCIGV